MAMPPRRGSSRGARWPEAALRGKRVAGLAPEAYGGYKDVNEAWAAGVLAVGAWPAAAAEISKSLEVPVDLQEAWGERVAIMVADGHLLRAEAERLAWAGLQPQRDPR